MNFQDNRFGECEKKAIKRIIDLIPIDNIWNYISIIFTHCFTDRWHKLEGKKKELLKNLKDEFKEIFEYSLISKAINPIDFNQIKIIFVDLNENFSNFEDVNEILIIMKESKDLSPLFYDCSTNEEKNVAFIEIDPNNNEKGKLYECDLTIYNYYNNKKINKSIKNCKKKI